MLTQAGCLARRARSWEAVPTACEWVLIADPRHVLYLSNFWIHPLSFSAGERCWLLLERDGKARTKTTNSVQAATPATAATREDHRERAVGVEPRAVQPRGQ